MSFGLIGVGFMGKGMLRNLLLKGERIGLKTVYCFDANNANIVELKDINESMKVENVSSPKDVIENCDVIGMSLPSEDICRKIMFDGDNSLAKFRHAKQKVIVDHGTYSRDFVIQTHKLAKQHNIVFLDAPVSGGPGGAWAGTLTTMIGGDEEIVKRCTPFLQLYSANIKHFGEIGKTFIHFRQNFYMSGSGMAAKLINQALVGIHAQAACEALYLAESFGITDVNKLKEMLSVSWGQSRVLELVFQDYINAKHRVETENINWENAIRAPSAAPLRNMLKDFKCIETDVPFTSPATSCALPAELSGKPLVLSTSAASYAINAACKKHGLQDAAFASMIEVVKNETLSS